MEWQKLTRIDPVGKQPERGFEPGHGISPMDPPDAYAPPSLDQVATTTAELDPFLRKLKESNADLARALNAVEDAVVSIPKSGYTRESDAALRRFFAYFDETWMPHSRREESILFPLLHERLIASGEHGKGDAPATAVDLMKDEHAKALQLAAVVVNFLGLVFRLPDDKSRLIVLDTALEECRNLIELLRLVVFRKDNVLYALANRLISTAEFSGMQAPAGQETRIN